MRSVVMKRTLTTVAAVFAVVCLLGPGSADAQVPKKAAKVHYDKAIADYNLGHFEDAIASFEKAYQIDPSPVLLFNIGQCHRQNGNKERAMFFYRRYLEQAPNAPNRAEVEGRIADLEKSLREEKDIQQRPPRELVKSTVGTEPSEPAATEPATGTPAGAASAPATPVPAVAPHSTTPSPTPPITVAKQEATPLRRTLAWTAGGAAAVAVAFGVLETIVWRGKISDFDNHTGRSPADPNLIIRDCGADDPNRGGEGCSELYDSISQAKTLAIVGYVAGGLLAAGSAVLFVTSGRSEPRGGLALSCGPGPTGVGLMCGGSF